jgi:hypothetical protein
MRLWRRLCSQILTGVVIIGRCLTAENEGTAVGGEMRGTIPDVRLAKYSGATGTGHRF